MFDFPIKYDEPVFRPPSEGKAFLIQLTIGCSNNLCTYCDMYRSKKYKVRELEDIYEDIEKSFTFFSSIGKFPSRIFLCDGDALGAPMEILVPVLERINLRFPHLERIGIYATAQNMLDKSVEDLENLASLKLNIAYLGMESGCDKVLHMVVKGNTQQDMIEGCLKLKKAGWKISIIAMLGLGGEKFSESHVTETAFAINTISPNYFSFLTTMSLPGTPYARMVDRGSIKMLTTKKLLSEMRDILRLITPQSNKILFRANHVSNQYPLGGELPDNRDSLVNIISSWIEQTPENTYPQMPTTM